MGRGAQNNLLYNSASPTAADSRLVESIIYANDGLDKILQINFPIPDHQRQAITNKILATSENRLSYPAWYFINYLARFSYPASNKLTSFFINGNLKDVASPFTDDITIYQLLIDAYQNLTATGLFSKSAEIEKFYSRVPHVLNRLPQTVTEQVENHYQQLRDMYPKAENQQFPLMKINEINNILFQQLEQEYYNSVAVQIKLALRFTERSPHLYAKINSEADSLTRMLVSRIDDKNYCFDDIRYSKATGRYAI